MLEWADLITAPVLYHVGTLDFWPLEFGGAKLRLKTQEVGEGKSIGRLLHACFPLDFFLPPFFGWGRSWK